MTTSRVAEVVVLKHRNMKSQSREGNGQSQGAHGSKAASRKFSRRLMDCSTWI